MRNSSKDNRDIWGKVQKTTELWIVQKTTDLCEKIDKIVIREIDVLFKLQHSHIMYSSKDNIVI